MFNSNVPALLRVCASYDAFIHWTLAWTVGCIAVTTLSLLLATQGYEIGHRLCHRRKPTD